MSEVYTENSQRVSESNPLKKASGWLVACATSAFLGLDYISTHTATGDEIVASTTLGGNTYGFDMSEILIGGIAVGVAAICIENAYARIEEYISNKHEKDS